jgi:hypothetical protein
LSAIFLTACDYVRSYDDAVLFFDKNNRELSEIVLVLENNPEVSHVYYSDYEFATRDPDITKSDVGKIWIDISARLDRLNVYSVVSFSGGRIVQYVEFYLKYPFGEKEEYFIVYDSYGRYVRWLCRQKDTIEIKELPEKSWYFVKRDLSAF